MSKKFEPVHVCIYCGGENNLTSEHVVPLALNGDLELPKSSCLKCNAITTTFEQKSLRGFMRDARAVGKFKTRRPKERPTEINLDFIRTDETTERAAVPVAESLAFLHLPIFEEALFPYGHKSSRGAKIKGIETLKFGGDVKKFILDRNLSGISKTTKIDVYAFAQLLAKTAYSFYVGVKGIFPMDESPALALIKGDVKDASNWVGSTFLPISSEDSKSLHRLATKEVIQKDGGVVDVVLIQFFASEGTCTYEVVVRATGWKRYLNFRQKRNLPTPA